MGGRGALVTEGGLYILNRKGYQFLESFGGSQVSLTGHWKSILGKYHYTLALFLYSSLGVCYWPLLETGFQAR